MIFKSKWLYHEYHEVEPSELGELFQVRAGPGYQHNVVRTLVFRWFNSSIRISKQAASLPCICLCWCHSHLCMRQMNASTDREKVTSIQRKEEKAHCSRYIVKVSYSSKWVHSDDIIQWHQHPPNQAPPPCTSSPNWCFDLSSFSAKPSFPLSIPHPAFSIHTGLLVKMFCSAIALTLAALTPAQAGASPNSPSEFYLPVTCLRFLTAPQSASMIIYVIMHEKNSSIKTPRCTEGRREQNV